MVQRNMISKNFFAALLVAVLIAGASAADSIDWGNSYPGALARAQSTGKPVLLYVDADYCAYCKQMDREAFVDSRAVLLSQLYVPCKVDGEHEGKPLIKKYGIKMYPYEAVLDDTGTLLTPAPEYMDPDKYARTLSAALPAVDLDRLKADHTDAVSAAQLIVVDAETGDIAGAESVLPGFQSSIPPLTAAAYHALGDAYFAEKDYGKAADAYRMASGALGDCHEAVGVDFRLADCCRELGKTVDETAVLTSIERMKSADHGEKKDAGKRLRGLPKG